MIIYVIIIIIALSGLFINFTIVMDAAEYQPHKRLKRQIDFNHIYLNLQQTYRFLSL